MKFLFTLFVALWMIISFTPGAKADTDGPVWTCNLTANAEGRSLHLLIGATEYKGEGSIRCFNLMGGDTGEIPMRISYSVWGLGLGYAEVDEIFLLSAGIKVADPAEIFGTYGVAHLLGASVIAGGVDVDMVAQLDRDGVGIDLGFRGKSVRGLELTALNFGNVEISAR